MTQFIVVAAIVGGITAYFFGVPASLRVGRDLTDLWITAGLLALFLEPIFDLLKLGYFLFRRIAGLFRR